MASKKTTRHKAAGGKAAAKAVSAKVATTAEKSITSRAAPVSPAATAAPIDSGVSAAVIGSSEAVCVNLAALREALASEKARDGAAERKKIARQLESLEAGYRELHR
jgi:hypothetical protein